MYHDQIKYTYNTDVNNARTFFLRHFSNIWLMIVFKINLIRIWSTGRERERSRRLLRGVHCAHDTKDKKTGRSTGVAIQCNTYYYFFVQKPSKCTFEIVYTTRAYEMVLDCGHNDARTFWVFWIRSSEFRKLFQGVHKMFQVHGRLRGNGLLPLEDGWSRKNEPKLERIAYSSTTRPFLSLR